MNHTHIINSNPARTIAALALLAALFAFFSTAAYAQSDITGVVTSVSGYWDAIKVIGIAILLWMLGRRVIKKGV